MVDLLQIAREVVAELEREAARRRLAETARREDAARRFLAELDPGSQEGLWFDALAGQFPFRLAAAVAYVEEVKRPDRHR